MATNQQHKPEELRTLTEGSDTPEDQNWLERMRYEMTDFRIIQKMIIDPPQGQARGAWDRYNLNPENKKRPERMKLSAEAAARKMFEALAKEYEAQAKTKGEASAELQAVKAKMRDRDKDFERLVSVVSQSVKLQNTPYAPALDIKTSTDVLDPVEGVQLEQWGNFIKQLDAAELMQMTDEDQEYVTMLVEQMIADKRGIKDIDAGELNAPSEANLVSPRLSLDNAPAVREANYRKLIKFIAHDKEEGAPREKSKARITTESVLWVEIVRAMDFNQKKYLTERFIIEKGPQKTKDFLRTAVVSRVLTKSEIQEMCGLDGEFEKIKDVLETIDTAVAGGRAVENVLKAAIAKRKGEYIQSAAGHFVTFNKIVMGRVAELGLLTAGLNMFLAIAERVKRRFDHNRDEGLAEAVVRGFVDGAGNECVIGGVAATIFGLNAVIPFVRRWGAKATQKERDQLARAFGGRYFNEHLKNNPKMAAYFLENFDDFAAIAQFNKNNKQAKISKNKEDRGEFDLYPGDIDIPLSKALELGYATRADALGVIHGLFTITANVKGLKNSTQLRQYYSNNKISLPSPQRSKRNSKEKPKQQ